jgi:3-oxoacyl-[acyl-carrier-protein] synthase II
MEQRVVVTGIGVLVPGAMDAESLWTRVQEGKSALDRLNSIETSDLPLKIGGELTSFDPKNFIEQRQVRRMDRYAQLSVSGAILACKDAGIEPSQLRNIRTGVFEGTSLGPLGGTLDYHRAYVTNKCNGIHPHLLMTSMMGSGSGFMSLILGTHGPSTTISDGSASSTCAIGYAFRQIKNGVLDSAIAGGAETPLSREIIATFCSARLLSKKNEEPSLAIKPFDRDRDGFLLSEGAVFLFLESLEHALDRGANIYAEIAGFGETTDAYHPTSPHPEGYWIAEAMQMALNEASLQPSEIQYLNAHGTATKINDVVESRAIQLVFSRESDYPFVSSTKPITGHLLGACGALESAITILSIKNQFAPGTISLRNPDVECKIKSLTVKGVPAKIRNVMNNNCSFGGRNASLVFRSYQINQV